MDIQQSAAPGRLRDAAKVRAELTPELVRLVASKVFTLWQRDLAIERERQRPSGRWPMERPE